MRQLIADIRVRRLAGSLAFVAVLALVLTLVTAVLRPQSGGVAWSSLRLLPRNTADVIVFGNSHAFTSIDPATVWRESGIPTFVNAGPTQKLDVTEYYIRQTLLTQHPSVIALEVSSASYDATSFSWPFHSINIDFMPWTPVKLEALWNTTPASARTELPFELWATHGRWPDLRLADFNLLAKQRGADYLMGFVPNFISRVVTSTPVVPSPADLTLTGARVDYNTAAIRRIARLCAGEHIRLLLYVSPTGPPEAYGAYLEPVARVARSAGADVATLDLSTPGAVSGLDYTTDFFDAGHVDWKGAQKTSAAFARFLVTTYGLKDRTDDPALALWARDAHLRDAFISRGQRSVRSSSAK